MVAFAVRKSGTCSSHHEDLTLVFGCVASGLHCSRGWMSYGAITTTYSNFRSQQTHPRSLSPRSLALSIFTFHKNKMNPSSIQRHITLPPPRRSGRSFIPSIIEYGARRTHQLTSHDVSLIRYSSWVGSY